MELQSLLAALGFGSWKKDVMIHENHWIWGTTYVFIVDHGKAILKLSVDNDEPNTGILSGFSVLQGYRSKGYGNKTLDLAISTAQDLGLSFLEISAEKLPENEWIIEWYQRKGFTLLDNKDPDYVDFKMYLKNEGDKGIITDGEIPDNS